MSAMQHGDTILANLHKSLEFCLKHCGDIGKCYSLSMLIYI